MLITLMTHKCCEYSHDGADNFVQAFNNMIKNVRTLLAKEKAVKEAEEVRRVAEEEGAKAAAAINKANETEVDSFRNVLFLGCFFHNIRCIYCLSRPQC